MATNLPATAQLRSMIKRERTILQRRRGAFAKPFLKLSRLNGRWSYGEANTLVMPTDVWAIDPNSLAKGYILWSTGNQKLDEKMAFLAEGDAALIDMASLGDAPAGSRGWQQQWAFDLRLVHPIAEQGEAPLIVTYKQSSLGFIDLVTDYLADLESAMDEGADTLLVSFVQTFEGDDETGYYNEKQGGGWVHKPYLFKHGWYETAECERGPGGELSIAEEDAAEYAQRALEHYRAKRAQFEQDLDPATAAQPAGNRAQARERTQAGTSQPAAGNGAQRSSRPRQEPYRITGQSNVTAHEEALTDEPDYDVYEDDISFDQTPEPRQRSGRPQANPAPARRTRQTQPPAEPARRQRRVVR